VWAIRATVNGIPIFICTYPELEEMPFHAWEGSIIDIADCSMVPVAFRVLVGIIVPDKRQMFKCA
jgi:hypothetical protein